MANVAVTCMAAPSPEPQSSFKEASASAGRKPRGRRATDLFIAATALAAGLPLYTRNPGDFAGLADLVDVRQVELLSA